MDESEMLPSDIPSAYGGTGADGLGLATERCVNCGDFLAGERMECGHVVTREGTWVTASWCDQDCYDAKGPSGAEGSYGHWRSGMGIRWEVL